MKIIIALIILLIPTKIALAHCPLCTVGAGALAFGAATLGVSNTIIGAGIGAFAIAIGLWLAPLIKKQFIPIQAEVIAIISFFGTVLPLYPIMKQYGSLYFYWLGEYGTTIPVNLFLLGNILGAIIMFSSPWISRKVSLARGGKILPYQGIMITFILLITISLLADLIL